MQKFIPSVLSALVALFKGSTSLLWKVISIFSSRRESPPPPPIPSSASYSLSDLPYESAHSQHQRSYELTRSQQQRKTRHLYPPPRPVAEHSQSPSAHQSPSQYTPYRPNSQPSVRFPAEPTHPVSPDVPSVTEPIRSHIPQSSSQHTPYQPDRQPSVRFPAQPALPISPDVAPVIEPVRSRIPRRSRHISGPELNTRAPEVVVTPIVIDPHEDAHSLRLKARNERSRMEGCFKQSREAFDGNNPELAQQLSLRGETHRDNMERLNKAASTKIFQENNQVCCFSYETPNRQPSVRFPAQPTPPVSPDVPSVTKPVRSHITQSPSQHTPYQPDRQPSARLPAQPTLPTSFDVDPVTEPVRSHIPRRSRRFSRPELAIRAPEVVVAPIVIDPHEDAHSLRLKARNEGNLMEECFDRSREAFACHNGALARQLSLDGEAHKANMERLDEAASTKIFQENNQGLRPDTVELHGLFVSEAKSYFSNAVRRARDSGESPLYVIVGRGNHSENNIPRIKPEIQEYGRSLGLGVEVDPHNDGRLIVSLNSS